DGVREPLAGFFALAALAGGGDERERHTGGEQRDRADLLARRDGEDERVQAIRDGVRLPRRPDRLQALPEGLRQRLDRRARVDGAELVGRIARDERDTALALRAEIAVELAVVEQQPRGAVAVTRD